MFFPVFLTVILAPFPAGLRFSENPNDSKKDLVKVSEQSNNKTPDNEGAQGEN